MVRRILLLAGIGWFAVAGLASAKDETARETLEAIPAQVRVDAEAKKKGQGPQGTGQTDPAYLLTYFRNAREFLENGDESSAVQQLRQLQSTAASGPVQDACEVVIRKLREERAAKDTAATAEITGLLQHAGEAVMAAKVPKDLDPILRELATATDKHGPGHSAERNNDLFNTRLQIATRFVARWQDYLLSASRSDSRPGAETLRTLAQETETFQMLGIPRSEIIGRLSPPPAPAEAKDASSRRVVPMAEVDAAIETAFNRLKSLDDLRPAVHDLTKFRDEVVLAANGYGNVPNELSATLTSLQALQQAYLEVQTGVNRWQTTWSNRYDTSGDARGESRFVALRAQLIALSLPRMLGAPETEKPAAGERVDAFLDRLLTAAKKRGDWQAVARGVECRHQFAPNPEYSGGRSDASAEETAFKQFFAGQNFEQAAQYEQAVVAYLSALGSGSQEIPVAVISERLAAIQKAHPAEYAGGNSASFGSGAAEEPLARRSLIVPPSEPPVATPTPAPTPAAGPSPSPPVIPAASPNPPPLGGGPDGQK